MKYTILSFGGADVALPEHEAFEVISLVMQHGTVVRYQCGDRPGWVSAEADPKAKFFTAHLRCHIEGLSDE